MNWLDLGVSLSKSFQFDRVDAMKVVRHAVVVGVAAGLGVLVDSVGGMNFGVYTALLVPVISSALNAAMRYVKSNE